MTALPITGRVATALDAYRAATAETSSAARALGDNPNALPRFEQARKVEADAARWLATVVDAHVSTAPFVADRIEALCKAFGLSVVEHDTITTPDLTRSDRWHVLNVPVGLDPLDLLRAVVDASARIAGEPVANVARAFKLGKVLRGGMTALHSPDTIMGGK